MRTETIQQLLRQKESIEELREQNRILRENGMKAETRAIKAEADADELKKGNKKILAKLTNL